MEETIETRARAYALERLHSNETKPGLVPVEAAALIAVQTAHQFIGEAAQAVAQGKRLELAATVLGGLMSKEHQGKDQLQGIVMTALVSVDMLFKVAAATPDAVEAMTAMNRGMVQQTESADEGKPQ